MSDKYRGHEIEQIYVYKDNKQPVSENPNRACGYCGKENTKEGHDGCLGTLPNVINACCGHGEEEEAYVMFNNKAILRGREAIDFQNKLLERERDER